jgi:hypothetical protein
MSPDLPDGLFGRGKVKTFGFFLTLNKILSGLFAFGIFSDHGNFFAHIYSKVVFFLIGAYRLRGAWLSLHKIMENYIINIFHKVSRRPCSWRSFLLRSQQKWGEHKVIFNKYVRQ